MNVYVLVTHCIYDFDDGGITTRVFASSDKAKEALRAYRDAEMPYVEKNGWEVSNDDEGFFEAYRDGYWAEDHTCAYIDEVEIE